MVPCLELAREARGRRVKVYNDSKLVVEQVKGSYKEKESTIVKYLAKAKCIA